MPVEYETDESTMQALKRCKTCEQCRIRKVRCLKSEGSSSRCINCESRRKRLGLCLSHFHNKTPQKREAPCHYRFSKRIPRRFLKPDDHNAIYQTPSTSEHKPKFSSDSRTKVSDASSTPGMPTVRIPLPAVEWCADYFLADSIGQSQIRIPLVNNDDAPPVDAYARSQLYMEYLLEDRHAPGRNQELHDVFKAHDNYVGSSNMHYFSPTRLKALSKCLGHNKVDLLIEKLEAEVAARRGVSSKDQSIAECWRKPSALPSVLTNTAQRYIASYFEQVHPVYPFIHRGNFERKAKSPTLSQELSSGCAWPALYFTVLALGSQYHEGGSFEPGTGEAWRFFQVALGLLPELLLGRGTLMTIQAVTAMAIFSLNISCMQIDELMISEAARMAQAMALQKCTEPSDQEFRNRTFWVIYNLEKSQAFSHGQSSGLMDCDIGCPIPLVPESVLGSFDWFLANTSFSRLLSKTYELLFSITATVNSPMTYCANIDRVIQMIERWRLTIPIEFRPGEPIGLHALSRSCEILMTLQLHYSYYDAIISICRLTLHVVQERSSSRYVNSTRQMMQAARSVIEMSKYIEMEPYTPIDLIAVTPLCAMFILFEFVVHNPIHPETTNNLALLDVAAGHFSRLEYATRGSFPSSMLNEFAFIARQFVRDHQLRAVEEDCRNEASESAESSQFLQVSVGDVQSDATEPSQKDESFNALSQPLYFPIEDYSLPGDSTLTGFDIMDLFGLAESDAPSFFDPDWL